MNSSLLSFLGFKKKRTEAFRNLKIFLNLFTFFPSSTPTASYHFKFDKRKEANVIGFKALFSFSTEMEYRIVVENLCSRV